MKYDKDLRNAIKGRKESNHRIKVSKIEKQACWHAQEKEQEKLHRTNPSDLRWGIVRKIITRIEVLIDTEGVGGTKLNMGQGHELWYQGTAYPKVANIRHHL